LKGVDVIKMKKRENENWTTAKTFIEHFQMKNGYISLTEVSNALNQNGYKTRKGCLFYPGTVKRLL
jgi:hypothetical protein